MARREEPTYHMTFSMNEETAQLLERLTRDHQAKSKTDFIRQAIQAMRYMMVPLAPSDTQVVNEAVKGLASVPLSVSSLIIPERKTSEGFLLKATSSIFMEVMARLQNNWAVAYELPPERWEEIVAAAFLKDGYDEVTLTKRSGDDGRDVIAVKRGIGCIKVIGSVKAYRPGHLVRYDDVRALLGVMAAEQDTSKGLLATTSDFPVRLPENRFIKPFVPTRLELMNGQQLQRWLLKPHNAQSR